MENNRLKTIIMDFQRNEITDHRIYQKIAKSIKHLDDKKIVEQISSDEKKHYDFWESHTNINITPNYFREFLYLIIIKIFGIKIGIKLMEKREKKAQIEYTAILLDEPKTQWIIDDEIVHEKKLMDLII